MGSRGFKAVAAAACLVIAAGSLVALVAGARHRGKESYCRNNLRRLGVLAHKELLTGHETGEQPEGTGRTFWQWIRERNFRTAGGTWEPWPGPNPFGCPVLGRAPLDLMAMPRDEHAKYMADPATIDFRGPVRLPGKGATTALLGADRPGNHPDGGHVLLADFSIRKTDGRAIAIESDGESWSRAAAESGD